MYRTGSLFTHLVEIECARASCKNKFMREPSRLKHGRGIYCSRTCQYAGIRERPKKGEERICLNCGKKFWLRFANIGKPGAGKYCKRSCRDAHWHGENNPNYINGASQGEANYRGPNWPSQKRKAKQRDKYTCQGCGRTHADCIRDFGQPTQVHHIRPYRLFDDYVAANDLSNLITLCPSCHRTAEAAFRRQERKAENHAI